MKGAGVISAVLIICVCPAAFATMWHVDDSVAASSDGKSWETAFKKIQEGIDAASNGDTVIVAEGTYLENVNFNGKNIVLTGTDPLSPQVVDAIIVDGNQAGSVVAFAGTEDETCVLSGFTIKGGNAERGGGILGGTFDKRTHATIRNNTISGNSASYGGAVSYCDGIIENNLVTGNSAEHYGGGLAYCSGTVRGNTITNNVAWGSETGYGGGLGACRATIENNTIAGNRAKDGGGVCLCDGIIQNNTIEGNSARDGGGIGGCRGTIESNTIAGNDASRTGGGFAWCDATIRNNTISGNRAAGDGGGLYGCNGTIQNNTINGNSAEGDRGGGGLAVCNGIIENDLVTANSARHGGGLHWCDGTLRNNTITRNSAEDYGGGISDCHGAMGNSIVWGNSAPTAPQVYNSTTPTYSCVQHWTQGGEGNVILDPTFVDPDGPDDDPDTWQDNNYRLGGNSPCIDSGKNEAWMTGAFDLDGNPRILIGVSSATVDMGAYEYYPLKITKIGMDSGGTPSFTWTSRPGDAYVIWSCSDLAFGSWTEVETVPSQGTETTWAEETAAPRIQFYRVELKQANLQGGFFK